MTNDGKFTGKLSHDSPHLFGLVTRYLDQSATTAVEHSYELSWKYGGTEHPTLPRQPGVSFNPRSARIAALMISEGGVRETSVICAGILTVAKLPHAETYIGLDSKTSEILVALHEKMESSEACECISIATMLDTIRHLHMMKISPQEIESILENASSVEIKILPETSRLVVLFRAALDRARRTLL